jgi:CubicO group peptidase (beta-lactamase class C family)
MPSRKLRRIGSIRFRLVASFRQASTGRGGMFFACGMYQRRLVVLVLTALAAVLVSSCGGGGGSQEEQDSAPDTTSTEDTEQAPEGALNAALEQSFAESGAPGVVAAVQTPEYMWVRALGVADRTSEEPMTPDVHHRIGSLTKTFTPSRGRGAPLARRHDRPLH